MIWKIADVDLFLNFVKTKVIFNQGHDEFTIEDSPK